MKFCIDLVMMNKEVKEDVVLVIMMRIIIIIGQVETIQTTVLLRSAENTEKSPGVLLSLKLLENNQLML